MAGSAEEVDDESPACSSMRRENGDVAIRFEILGELRVRDGEEPTPRSHPVVSESSWRSCWRREGES
jgi:hypothetical protein